ncbi:MAG: DUF2190 family protein [candidate division WOR-3 bacterium]|nr:DUF2190 family protein [candidate division WOR-3 bacterium]
MKNPEVYPFPTQYVPFTADADYSAGDLKKIGNWYGRVVDNVKSGAPGMLAIRGIFEIPKATASDAWAAGAVLEYVAPGEGETDFKVQVYTSGTKIGKAFTPTTNGETTAHVMLMPELY